MGEPQINFRVNFSSRLQKKLGTDMLEFLASDFAEVVSGGKECKTAAKSGGRKTLRKH